MGKELTLKRGNLKDKNKRIEKFYSKNAPNYYIFIFIFIFINQILEVEVVQDNRNCIK
jgi:hypothetical protein